MDSWRVFRQYLFLTMFEGFRNFLTLSYAMARLSDKQRVRMSVRLSVCLTFAVKKDNNRRTMTMR